MSTLDFTRALNGAHESKINRAASRAARKAAKASELQAKFISAAFGSDPTALVPTPGLPVPARPIGYLLLEEIDGGQLAALLRDAVQSADMRIHVQLLVSVLARKFADRQADYWMEQEDEAEDGPDPDERHDRLRDNAIEGLS
jgi:hypothetical protein